MNIVEEIAREMCADDMKRADKFYAVPKWRTKLNLPGAVDKRWPEYANYARSARRVMNRRAKK